MTDELKAWSEEQAYERAKAKYMEKLDKIRAEIEGLTYYWCEVNPNSVINDVLQIIDKYREEQEDNGFFDEIMNNESEDEETYEKIKEIIEKVKEQ